MQKGILDNQIEELERLKKENKAKIEALKKTIQQLKNKVLKTGSIKINTLEKSLHAQDKKIKKITQRLDYIKNQIEKK